MSGTAPAQFLQWAELLLWILSVSPEVFPYTRSNHPSISVVFRCFFYYSLNVLSLSTGKFRFFIKETAFKYEEGVSLIKYLIRIYKIMICFYVFLSNKNIK